MKKILLITLLSLFIFPNFIEANSINTIYQQGYVDGFFIEFDGNNIVVEEYGGSIYSLPIIREPILEIDGRPVSRDDFKMGMEVYLELQGRSVKYMDAYSSTNPGYIQEGERVRTGVVRSITENQIKILSLTGEEEVYSISPSTRLMKNKEVGDLRQLYVGDRVRLSFTDKNTSYIDKIQVEGDSILIRDLYRGEIHSVSRVSNHIVFKNIHVFRNGRWQLLENTMSLPYNGETSIYINGQEVSPRNLEGYRGQTAYMAIRDDFGINKIEKMVLKQRYENNFSNKIRQISFFASQMELSNKQNITFNEGTMVIRNGRLIDSQSILPGSDGFIVADGRGLDLFANIIYIYNEDINNSKLGVDRLYAGRINTVLENKVYLKDFFLLDQNQWKGFKDEKQLFYDDDTYIYDMEKRRQISTKEFLAGNYSVDERGNRYLSNRDYHGYIYTDGDRIGAIYLKKSMDSLLAQRTTIGIAKDVPYENPYLGYAVDMINSKDWSNLNSRWMEKNATLNIYLREAMIVKNGKIAGIKDIKAGDRLYLVRDSNMAKIIIVK